MDPVIDVARIENMMKAQSLQFGIDFPTGYVEVPRDHQDYISQKIHHVNLIEDELYLAGCYRAHRVCDVGRMTSEDHMDGQIKGVVDIFKVKNITIFTLQDHRTLCVHQFLIPETPSAAFLIHGKKSPELALCYRGEYGILVCCHALWGEESGETFVARILDDIGYEKTLAILIYRIAMEYPYMTGAGTLFTPVSIWVPFEGIRWDVLLAKVQKHLELLSPTFGRDSFLSTEDECDTIQVYDLGMPGWIYTDE